MYYKIISVSKDNILVETITTFFEEFHSLSMNTYTRYSLLKQLTIFSEKIDFEINAKIINTNINYH